MWGEKGVVVVGGGGIMGKKKSVWSKMEHLKSADNRKGGQICIRQTSIWEMREERKKASTTGFT